MGAVFELDEKRSAVRVGGSMAMGELAARLAERGYRLPTLGTSAYPTVAGGLATALHGSGSKYGTLSGRASCRAMRMVLASGERVSLDGQRTEDERLLPAVRVHLGAFGFVEEATLAVERGTTFEWTTEPILLDEVVGRMRESDSEHVEAWWVPYTKQAMLVTRRVMDGASQPASKATRYARRVLGEDVPMRALIEAVRRAPRAAPFAMRALAKVGMARSTRVERWDSAMVGPRSLKAIDAELAVPMEAAEAALLAVEAAANRARERTPWHVPVNLRCVRADDGAWLSPASERDSFYIDVGWHPSIDGGTGALDEVIEALRPFGGREHWGKRVGPHAARRYPRFGEWEAVRKELDPDGRFVNAMLNDLIREGTER